MVTELIKEVKELKRLEQKLYRELDIDEESKIIEKVKKMYEKVFYQILNICKQEGIEDYEEFDKKYNVFEKGLEEFIYSLEDFYTILLSENKEDIKKELEILQNIIEQFNVEVEHKQRIILIIIMDKWHIGYKKEAEKELKEFIKENPDISEGYEIICHWELEKEKPDMEKIADMIMEAEDNNASITDEKCYEEVIKYYHKKGDKENEHLYKWLLNNIKEQEKLENIYDDSDIFDENIEEDDYFDDENEEETLKQIIIEEIKHLAKDTIKKGKTFEEYIKAKDKFDAIRFLGPQTAFSIELEDARKDIKKYILNNYRNILKENMKYMPKNIIDFIKSIPDTGIKEISLEDKMPEEILEILKTYTLNNFLLAFWQMKNNKLIISVPLIIEMKQYLKDKEVIKENKKINEIASIVKGMTTLYGAIKAKKVYHILSENIYKNLDKDYCAKLLIIICNFLNIATIKIDQKEKSLDYIYSIDLGQKIAKDILKNQREIIALPKEEYIKYSKENYWKEFNGYKKLIKELDKKVFGKQIIYVIDDIMPEYVLSKQINDEHSNELLDRFLYELNGISKEMGIKSIKIDKLKTYFKEIDLEIPKWR